MATAIDNLKTARDNFAAKLADWSANPKPSYSVDGQQISWSQYGQMLSEGYKAATDAINGQEPYQYHTTAVTSDY